MKEYRTIAAIIYNILQRYYILMFVITNKDLNTKLGLTKVSLGNTRYIIGMIIYKIRLMGK